MEKLDAGVDVKVFKADGTDETVKVRQIPLKDYKRGFAASDDEFATVGLIVERDEAWVYSLTPDSYELLLEEGHKVNKSFFAFCARRHAELVERLNQMRPEMAKAALEKISSLGSPARVPRPVS